MLNPFPHLLVYSFFAPTLLRIAVACVFAYLAVFHFRHRREVASEVSMLSAGVAIWIIGLYIAIEAMTALGLFLGYDTQIAALVGAILSLKLLLLRPSLRHVAPLSRLTYALVGVICLSLLVLGAGAVAFDLPL